MRDWIADDAAAASGGNDGLKVLGISEFPSWNLSGSSLFSWIDGSKREHAAGADAEHAADESLFAHAESDHLETIAVLLQELHHDYIVVKTCGGGDDLEEVGRILPHPPED